ncbi:MAG TPA: hypothetical protein VI365_15950 [Trebonia sp.]
MVLALAVGLVFHHVAGRRWAGRARRHGGRPASAPPPANTARLAVPHRRESVRDGTIPIGSDSEGTRNRPSVRGKTKTEVNDKLDKLREEINVGVRTPATYTSELCVKDWLDSIERDPHTMATITKTAAPWPPRSAS